MADDERGRGSWPFDFDFLLDKRTQFRGLTQEGRAEHHTAFSPGPIKDPVGLYVSTGRAVWGCRLCGGMGG